MTICGVATPGLCKLLVLVMAVGLFVLFFGGGKVHADQVIVTHQDSSVSRGTNTLCNGNTRVDFVASITNVHLDTSNGKVTYDVNLAWKQCTSSLDRAFAIVDEGDRNICPLAGTYGTNNSDAYDCVKYIGPAGHHYEGESALTCAGGANGDCVCPNGAAAAAACARDDSANFRKAVRQEAYEPPSSGASTTIHMEKTISNWGSKKYNQPGSKTYGGSSNNLCEYFKYGNSNTPSPWPSKKDRCMTVSVTVSWYYDYNPTGSAAAGACAADGITLSGSVRDANNTRATMPVRVLVGGGQVASGNFTGGSYGFSRLTNSSWNAVIYTVQAASVDYNGNATGAGHPTVTWVTIAAAARGPCAVISCGNQLSGDYAAGTTIHPQVTVNVSLAPGGPNPAGSFKVQVSSPNGVSTTLVAYGGRSGNTLSSVTFALPIPRAGNYTIKWGYENPGHTDPSGNHALPYVCGGGTVTGSVQPYFSVQGGDIAAGAGFFDNGVCTENPARIAARNINASPFTGAGTTVGAWASDPITNFVSGLSLGGSPRVTTSLSSTFTAPSPGAALSFANVAPANVDTANGRYGGNFGADSIPCIHNYYGTKPAGTHVVNETAVDVGTLPAGSSSWSGSVLTLNPNGVATVAAGRTVSLYVQGNVWIKNDIVYAPYTLTTVPRFNLYVKGNIYIAPGVHEIHGVYMAQKDGGSSGDIVTCNEASGSVVERYATCSTATTPNQSLLVVGAMAAEGKLALTRTYGNYAGNDPLDGATVNPAEVFSYGPELWLGGADENDLSVQSYTSLPPIL